MNTPASLEMIQAQRVERLLQIFGWVTDRLGRNVPAIVEMDDLRSLPPGTLGHAWAEHLDANYLTIN
jgi:ubiquinone biosynthesis protein Coq4